MSLLLSSLVIFAVITPAFGHWGCVVDAGSSGSRLRLYQWGARPTWDTDPNITEYLPTNKSDQNLLEIRPGISAYVSNPSAVGDGLGTLITQGKRWIPEAEWSKTPIILRATAGMRLLDTTQQNAVFGAIRTFFKDTTKNPFKFEDSYASIASGEQEAVWSWVMVNYVQGKLKANTTLDQYHSHVEMGGASAQIAFIPTDELLGNRFDITVFGKVLSLYAHSFLYFGKDQFLIRARKEAISKLTNGNVTVAFPCFYVGYTDYYVTGGINYTFVGTGNWDSCYTTITEPLMGLDIECLQPPCSYYGVYQPSLPTPRTYWGISAYFYAVQAIGLVAIDAEWTGVVSDIIPKGQAQCAKNWTTALADAGTSNAAFAPTYCFDATFVVAMLRAHGAETVPVSYSRRNKGQTIGWTLGALVDELNLLPLDLSKFSGGMMQTPTFALMSFMMIMTLFWLGF